MNLKTPLTNLERVYKMYAGRLAKLNIFTFEDFLYHIPTRYEDFSLISPIEKVQPGENVTIQGKVVQIKNIFTKNYKKIQQAKVEDGTGEINVLWFNQPFLLKTIHKGDSISLSGRVDVEGTKMQMISPDFEIIYGGKPPIHTGRLVPIYPETKGVSSKWLRRQVFKIIYEFRNNFDEYIPDPIINSIGLMGLNQSFEQIHFPLSLESAQKAKNRLSFDELFLLQLAGKQKRKLWQQEKNTNSINVNKFQSEIGIFLKSLPFVLTDAQKRVIEEIFGDISKQQPMNRLLQGDVGSGKTVVAAITMYVCYLNGYKSAFMAPTEILAMQHFETIKKLLSPLGVNVTLRTSSQKNIIDKKTDIAVGTHALLSEKVILENTGLIVIDEQQRFGVEQRATLKQKSANPHLLTMTATPIPRTVALTLYGNLDMSVIDEMPKKRKKIKTWLVPNTKRDSAYQWIEKQIKENHDQAFIVCPFIEESENMVTVKAATKEFEKLKKEIFPKLKLGLLHGKMKAKEKDKILSDFREKKIDILVATPVVEVGIDFPNATIIVVEAAERFGLAGLHQLRGRVGRGEKQSYCLLFTESGNEQTRGRLSALETMYNGAALAELDFRMRGPGNLYGVEQSGYNMLKVASFSDIGLIEQAKNAAEKIFPDIAKYPKLLKKVEQINQKEISPD